MLDGANGMLETGMVYFGCVGKTGVFGIGRDRFSSAVRLEDFGNW